MKRFCAQAVFVALAFGVSGASLGIADAAADPNSVVCQPGQVIIDGQCSVPPPPSDGQSTANSSAHDSDTGHGH